MHVLRCVMEEEEAAKLRPWTHLQRRQRTQIPTTDNESARIILRMRERGSSGVYRYI